MNITKEFGPGTGPIWLDDLDCDRTESSVFDCSSRPIGDPNDCQHSEDVGVICQGICSNYSCMNILLNVIYVAQFSCRHTRMLGSRIIVIYI